MDDPYGGLPEDVALYLLAIAGMDVSGVGLSLVEKYMPDVVRDAFAGSGEK